MDQGSNPCPLRWLAESPPPHYQGTPVLTSSEVTGCTGSRNPIQTHNIQARTKEPYFSGSLLGATKSSQKSLVAQCQPWITTYLWPNHWQKEGAIRPYPELGASLHLAVDTLKQLGFMHRGWRRKHADWQPTLFTTVWRQVLSSPLCSNRIEAQRNEVQPTHSRDGAEPGRAVPESHAYTVLCNQRREGFQEPALSTFPKLQPLVHHLCGTLLTFTSICMMIYSIFLFR